MTADMQPSAERHALDWAVRTGDPSFGDWDAFTAWLEADAANSDRYDAAVAGLADAAAIVAILPPSSSPQVVPQPVNDPQPVRRMRGRWAGGAIAATVAGVIGFSVWNDRAQPYDVTTAVGRQQTVQLADGSEIVVAGGSRLRLDRGDPRVATVERGAALFRVRHDDRNPFTVHAAGTEIVDLGTVFDVSRDAGVIRVAVAEGRVVIDPRTAALRLDPGQAVRVEAGRRARQSVEPAQVGGWRTGNLSFDDATLGEVAAALSRAGPRAVSVAPAIAGTRFRGTIDAAQVGSDPALLGRLLGVTVRASDAGWRLEPLR